MAKFSIIPRDEVFFELFERAAEKAVEGSETLLQMLADLPNNAEEYRVKMAEIEHSGDSVIHDVMHKLNSTFVTPLDHEDIRAISSRLDDIIDFTQAAVERLVLYQVKSPYPASVDLARILHATSKEAVIVVGMLRDLSKRREIVERCIEINRLENAGDKIYREALGNLFAQGDLLELLRWKEIFEQIEQAIDECEDLADVVESIVVKNA